MVGNGQFSRSRTYHGTDADPAKGQHGHTLAAGLRGVCSLGHPADFEILWLATAAPVARLRKSHPACDQAGDAAVLVDPRIAPVEVACGSPTAKNYPAVL